MSKLMMISMLVLLVTTAPAWAGEETTIDGVPTVVNSATPRDGVTDMELEELWRRGGEDDEIFFGLILKALSDDDGNVYLLDQQMSEVFVFGPDGEHVNNLSREGDGPGEVRAPTDMLWMPDGNLGIVQSFPGRIIKVELDNTPAGMFKTGADGAIIAVVEARSGGGNLVMGVIDIEAGATSQTRHTYLGSYDQDGVEQCRYTGFDAHWDFSKMVLREREQYFVMYGRWDLMKDGRVIAVPDFYDYKFNVYAADGTLQRSVTREFEPYEREDVDRELINQILEGTRAQFPFPIEVEIEDHETPIGQLVAHPSGETWVLTARGSRYQPEGVLTTWDVFDSNGHFDRQVQVKCPGDSRKDGIFFVGEDRLLVVHGLVDALGSQFGGAGGEEDPAAEETAPIEVVCYRIK